MSQETYQTGTYKLYARMEYEGNMVLFAVFLSLSLTGLFLLLKVIIKGGFMKNLKTKLLAVVLSCMLIISFSVSSFAAVNSDAQKAKEVKSKTKHLEASKADVRTALQKTVKLIYNDNSSPEVGVYDWHLFAVNRSGLTLTGLSEWNQKYVNSLDVSKLNYPSDYAKVIIGLSAAGADPTSVNGVNLLEKMLEDKDAVLFNLSNATFSLIALDTKNYDIPSGCEITRDDIINYLLNQNIEDGVIVAEYGKELDATYMAVQALAKYDDDAHPGVKAFIDGALSSIGGENQADSGLLYSWGSENVCTTSQALLAVIAAGKDPEEYSKAGNSIIDGILSKQTAEGAFQAYDNWTDWEHPYWYDDYSYSTPQAAYALAGYVRYTQGLNGIYDFSKEESVMYTLAAPKTVTVKAGKSSAKITFSKVANADSYAVYRSTKKASGYKKISTVKALSYTDSGLKPGVAYYYKVRGLKSDIYGAFSNAAVADIKVAAPKTVKAVAGKKKVTVKFSKSANAKKYYIYRSAKKTKGFKKIAAVKKLKYVDRKVKKGKAYFYKVKAVKSSKNISAFSKVVKTKKVK